MVVFIRNAVAAILCVLVHNTHALQTIGNGNGGSITPAPLCERVNLGTLSVSPMG